MSISQVDMLTVVPRTNEVSNIRQVEMQRPTQEQMQMNTMFQNNIKHDQKKTVETKKSENKEKRYDAKEKGNGQSFGEKKGKGKEKQEETSLRTRCTNGSSFDIKI